jgi:hypothetical protein
MIDMMFGNTDRWLSGGRKLWWFDPSLPQYVPGMKREQGFYSPKTGNFEPIGTSNPSDRVYQLAQEAAQYGVTCPSVNNCAAQGALDTNTDMEAAKASITIDARLEEARFLQDCDSQRPCSGALENAVTTSIGDPRVTKITTETVPIEPTHIMGLKNQAQIQWEWQEVEGSSPFTHLLLVVEDTSRDGEGGWIPTNYMLERQTMIDQSVPTSVTLTWPVCDGKTENLCVGETKSVYTGSSKFTVEMKHLLHNSRLKDLFTRGKLVFPVTLNWVMVKGVVYKDELLRINAMPDGDAKTAELTTFHQLLHTMQDQLINNMPDGPEKTTARQKLEEDFTKLGVQVSGVEQVSRTVSEIDYSKYGDDGVGGPSGSGAVSGTGPNGDVGSG